MLVWLLNTFFLGCMGLWVVHVKLLATKETLLLLNVFMLLAEYFFFAQICLVQMQALRSRSIIHLIAIMVDDLKHRYIGAPNL